MSIEVPALKYPNASSFLTASRTLDRLATPKPKWQTGSGDQQSSLEEVPSVAGTPFIFGTRGAKPRIPFLEMVCTLW